MIDYILYQIAYKLKLIKPNFTQDWHFELFDLAKKINKLDQAYWIMYAVGETRYTVRAYLAEKGDITVEIFLDDGRVCISLSTVFEDFVVYYFKDTGGSGHFPLKKLKSFCKSNKIS